MELNDVTVSMKLKDVTFKGYPPLHIENNMYDKSPIMETECVEFKLFYKGRKVPIIICSFGIIYPGRTKWLKKPEWKVIKFNEIEKFETDDEKMTIFRKNNDPVIITQNPDTDWDEFRCFVKNIMNSTTTSQSTIPCFQNNGGRSYRSRRKTKRAKKNKRRTRRS
jgi:hypothetical protein